MKKEETTNGTPEENEEPTAPSFTDILLESFFEKYEPTENASGAETKSTIEIMEEMSTVADVEKWEINAGLEQAGFKTTYIDGAFYWMLLPK